MVLADYTIEAGGTQTSSSDVPAGGTIPSFELNVGAGEFYVKGLPIGNEINGLDIRGIDNGQVEFFMKKTFITSSGQQMMAGVVARYIDATHHYLIYVVGDRPSGGQWAIVVKEIDGGTYVQKFAVQFSDMTALPQSVWHKFRISWWSAAGKVWFRIEYAVDSPWTTWVKPIADQSITTDLHKSSTNKIGWVVGSDASQFTAGVVRIDDFAVSKP